MIRLGRWQDCMKDIIADCLISDPPFSDRTHVGHDRAVNAMRFSGGESRTRTDKRTGAVYSVGVSRRKPLPYNPWSDKEAIEFVKSWSPRIDGWFVVLTDHVLVRAYECALLEAGRYVFAPLPFVAPGSTVRLCGDGPSSWTTWVVVARPKGLSKWGTLPGAYVLPSGQRDTDKFIGGKPLWLMRSIVRDYSRRGDLIVDPCCGYATTIIAAEIEGREAIGCEMDEETFSVAMARLSAPRPITFDFKGDDT